MQLLPTVALLNEDVFDVLDKYHVKVFYRFLFMQELYSAVTFVVFFWIILPVIQHFVDKKFGEFLNRPLA